MAVGDIVQVRMVMQFSNQIGVCTRHYKVTAVGGAGLTLQQGANAFDNLIAPTAKLALAAAASWRGVGFKEVFPVQTIEFASVANTGVGALAGDVLPPQTAGLIGFQTLQPGPTGHGRIYWPFPTESVNDASGLCTAAYQILIANIGTALAANFTNVVGADSVTYKPVLYNRITHGAKDISGFYVRSRWATQRRRGGFGAANQLPF